MRETAKMAADEWRLCVDWLVKCKILPDDHRATTEEAQAFDLAQALRDGVLLCHLLNALKSYSVDPKDFSPRPQLSQFLCLKNIRTFLQTCEKTFGVKSIDLFDPPDLFDVKNFRKVLHTLSKLSKTSTADGKVPGGFPPNNHRIVEHSYYNTLEDLALGFPPHNNHANDTEEDIYGNLSDMAIEHDVEDNEDFYDTVYQEGDDEIYEDLMSTKRRKPPERNSVSELPPPVTKRDYCIKEMVDTERNYVEALRMIVQHFIKPLKAVMSPSDREAIFSQIEPLQEVHTGFHAELNRACTTNKPKIHDVFIKWKTKFLLYGDYCSNLPKAQEHIEELTKKNEVIRDHIQECERKANDGRFRLRDLLHVPMQRVLKYHLLLRELMKNTDRTSEDVRYLQQALEAMQDLSLYVNEVKRDNEALQLIQEIQNSIVDLQMPQNTQLKDYGRLQKDGELKVKSHVDNRVKPRYIFLFDKVMLMGKSKGETYSFKEAIVLAEYKVDPTPAAKDAQKKASQWTFSFQMVKQDNALAYTFFAKTEDMKTKWIEAINLALDNTQPAAGKNFIMTTFTEAKVCDICGKLLRGVFFQGYLCPVTKQCVHKECIGKKKQEPVPHPPPRKVEKCRAQVPYNGKTLHPGRSRNVLKFDKNAIIEVLQKEEQWWKGSLNGEEGWFPAQLVEEHRQEHDEIGSPELQRKPTYEHYKVRHPRSQQTSDIPPHNVPPPAAHRLTHIEHDYSKYDWYVGPMHRDIAAEKLKRVPDGSFLLRDSENLARKGSPALSIKYAGTVRHIKIEKNQENMFFMADTKFFHSLPELVDYYQNHSLKDSFPEVQTSLLYPYKTAISNDNAGAANGFPSSQRGAAAGWRGSRQPDTTASGQRVMSYARAEYDYAATATTQITLKHGDRVAVLSKTGADKGWWKGEHCDTHRVGYFPYAYVREEDEE